MKKTATVLALAATLPLAASTTAQAKDLTGRFGLGGQLDAGTGLGGLSARYWISDLGFQAILGLGFKGEGDNGAPPSAFDLGLGVRVLYNFARANDTNMFVGGGVSLGLIDADATYVDLLLGVEHFFTNHFSVSGQVGLHVDVGSDRFGINLGSAPGSSIGGNTVASWGTAFHFYF